MEFQSPRSARSPLFALSGLLLVVLSASPLAQAQQRAAPYVGESLNGQPCASFEGTNQGYGPYDYRNYRASDRKLKIVEDHHFTREVKTLKAGENSATPVGDLNYTLMAFPNHHGALYAIIRLHTGGAEDKWASYSQFSSTPPPECFLQRAAAFTPKDPHVSLLYGIYLHRLGKTEKAIDKYQASLKIEEKFSEAWYNLGLAYMDMGKHKEARKAARQAYELGYPLPGLRKKLAEAGYSL